MKKIIVFLVMMFSSFTRADFNPVSFVKLIVSPLDYEGKRILVSGYLAESRGDPYSLYFTKDGFITRSPEHLIIDDEMPDEFLEKCGKGCYVSFIGEFKYNGYGRPTAFVGGLINLKKSIFIEK